MGWYLRKSVRMGPVRWNLSKSGIGMSVGVRGARVGVGPRGAYVAGGRGGLYFRQRIGTSGRRPRAVQGQQAGYGAPPGWVTTPSAPSPAQAAAAPMEYLPETDVTRFQPATADALARYIVSQRSHIAFFPATVIVLIVLNLAILGGYWPAAIVAVPLSAYGAYRLYYWDRQRTHVALHYDLDTQESQYFSRLCAGLAALASTMRLQRVEARQVHGDWKHQAGATTALKLAPITVLPPGRLRWLETNAPVWSIQWRQGGITLSFLPDRVIVQQRRAIAVLPYGEVQVIASLGRFVENSAVPHDARVLGYNWQYPNKNGGPDRRFKFNRQLPVTEAAYIGLQSASGLNLAIQASNRPNADTFVTSLRGYKPLVCAAPAGAI